MGQLSTDKGTRGSILCSSQGRLMPNIPRSEIDSSQEHGPSHLIPDAALDRSTICGECLRCAASQHAERASGNENIVAVENKHSANSPKDMSNSFSIRPIRKLIGISLDSCRLTVHDPLYERLWVRAKSADR